MAGIEEPKVVNIPTFVTILSGSNIGKMYRKQSEQHCCRSRVGEGCAMLKKGTIYIHISIH